jgi:microcompartment protein CcmK/EutM
MHLAKVIGTVVATQKHPALRGVKLLLLQPVDDRLRRKGDPIIAVDPNMQAGPGCVVTYVVGREAMLGLPTPNAPVDAGIVGVVDEPINREVE